MLSTLPPLIPSILCLLLRSFVVSHCFLFLKSHCRTTMENSLLFSYRDIPMPLVSSGVEHGNLRELAFARMKDLGIQVWVNVAASQVCCEGIGSLLALSPRAVTLRRCWYQLCQKTLCVRGVLGSLQKLYEWWQTLLLSPCVFVFWLL